MCGRFTLKKKPVEIEEAECRPALHSVSKWKARFNIAPAQKALVVRQSHSSNLSTEISYLRWGLIPSWSKSADSAPLINAQADTLAENPNFKSAYQKRRCLIPADGFYEWKRNQRNNQPYYFQLEDEAPFYMAGLWESWLDSNGNELESFTIITTQANSLLSKYHEQMPVILGADKKQEWLGGVNSPLAQNLVDNLLTPYPARKMKTHPVSQKVNNTLLDDASCIDKASPEPTTQLDLGF
ncbi:SOS response-associated peptidase [Puniceicoccaceae bacterium K14]|nr:SOS response-associated peptidase [Puniceicoccaceae bacterium K14]